MGNKRTNLLTKPYSANFLKVAFEPVIKRHRGRSRALPSFRHWWTPGPKTTYWFYQQLLHPSSFILHQAVGPEPRCRSPSHRKIIKNSPGIQRKLKLPLTESVESAIFPRDKSIVPRIGSERPRKDAGACSQVFTRGCASAFFLLWHLATRARCTWHGHLAHA